MTPLRYQDPHADDPAYLLENILDAASGATAGGALFAFASRDGVRLLFDDSDFRRFLARAPFELVVGVDAVTNGAALDALTAAAAACPRLSVSAFLHDRRTIFHPKVCWFETATGGRAFVGSGNLTAGGLSGNWEAYSDLALDPAGITALKTDWSAWMGRHSARLRPLDDPGVRAKAATNVMMYHRDRRVGEDTPPPEEHDNEAILVAEITRSSDRMGQVNFDVHTFQTFFGASGDRSRRILLWNLQPDGSLVGPEVRPGVIVKSHNYRFEVHGASGLEYPTGNDRPIGVFLRTSVRKFRYQILMPADPDYGAVSRLLAAQAGPRQPVLMRRVVIDRATVEASWTTCRLLSLPADAGVDPADA